jgi:GNAT superfamily N-acetyltransferase
VVAESAGETVGAALAVDLGRRSFRLAVRADRRGRGVGGQLLEHVAGAGPVRTAVLVGDDSSLEWAQRRGYDRHGQVNQRREAILAASTAEYQHRALAAATNVGTYVERWAPTSPDKREELRQLYERTKLGLPNDTPPGATLAEVDYLFPPVAEVLLARDGEVPVGIASIAPSVPGSWYNWYVGVVPEARRHGVARALKVTGFAVASEAGAVRLVTHNHAANDAMIALNESLGYRHVPQGDLQYLRPVAFAEA